PGEADYRYLSAGLSQARQDAGGANAAIAARRDAHVDADARRGTERKEEVAMAVTRRNILSNAALRDQFARGANLLKQESSGRTTSELGMTGPAVDVSSYDLFVIWHYQTMMTLTPPGNSSGRNAAHRGSIFLPWHRVMLMLFESNLQ